MTAGTSPPWRSLRALPVPLVSRAFAASETVAIPNFPYQYVLDIADQTRSARRVLSGGCSHPTIRCRSKRLAVRGTSCHPERSEGETLGFAPLSLTSFKQR